MAILLTYSDRGASPRPAHHRPRSRQDPGPLLRLMEQPESRGRYRRIVVLCPEAGQAGATELLQELRPFGAELELEVVSLPDPSDYERVFGETRDVLGRLALDEEIDVVLSAGTPQMQATWLLLVKAGLLDARMLQVVPSAFVPSPHPRAIKEVRLDFEGFPEILALRREVARLRNETSLGEDGIIGMSPSMRSLRRLIARVAGVNVPVLVHGETGTGKELVARAIHDASSRVRKPFIAESCATFAEGVLASELFGHERGAFTGAQGEHRGLFEQADGGTLFLDEVGELPPRVQANLLRVLQEGTLRRVGGERTLHVDVRLVAATHRDLRRMVADGEFREDLYYRLRGAIIEVPPLRERLADLGMLIDRFQAELDHRPRLTGDALRALGRYPWPGNVRELRAEVIRWSIFCDRVVRVGDLSPEVRLDVGGLTVAVEPTGAIMPMSIAVAAAEEHVIRIALDATDGNLAQAARALAVDRNTLKRKMTKLGLRK